MSLIGFTTNNGVDFTPDKSTSKSTTPKLAIAKFGDGYEQRARKGRNSLESTYSLVFSNRTLVEAEELCQFFDEVLGVNSFDYTLPGNDLSDYVTVRVVCETYSKTYDYNNYNTINATFRRVYE